MDWESQTCAEQSGVHGLFPHPTPTGLYGKGSHFLGNFGETGILQLHINFYSKKEMWFGLCLDRPPLAGEGGGTTRHVPSGREASRDRRVVLKTRLLVAAPLALTLFIDILSYTKDGGNWQGEKKSQQKSNLVYRKTAHTPQTHTPWAC